jgi:hypothetical protein
MIIKKRRIRNAIKYLLGIKKDEKFYLAISSPEHHVERLIKAGFTPSLVVGECILPASIFGPTSRFNAEGKEVPMRDKPMETLYRQTEWHWKDWGGHWHSKIVDVPYKRYPRKFVPPPGVELKIMKYDTSKIIVSDLLINADVQMENIRHQMNLLLEITGEFEVLNENLLPLIGTTPLKRVNWQLLPPGTYPWEKIESHLDPIIQKCGQGKKGAIKNRVEKINAAKPDFHAVGQSGFYGYVIFGFVKRNIYICESLHYGNATYIFKEDWETLSQKTKADILNNRLQKDRIIHQNGWEGHINKYLQN